MTAADLQPGDILVDGSYVEAVNIRGETVELTLRSEDGSKATRNFPAEFDVELS